MIRTTLLLAPSLLLLLATPGHATDDQVTAFKRNRLVRVETNLKSTEEVPVISSPNASGKFKATLDAENLTITYELSYEGLEGQVLAGHVHVGQEGVNGQIPLFICANAPALPPPGTAPVQACPPAPATVTGVWTPVDIIPRVTQGIDAPSNEDFLELINLMKAGFIYANVHTTKYIGGEVRGQVERDLFPSLKDLKDLKK